MNLTENSALAVGLPAGLSATAVQARMRSLIATGTPAAYARQFAIDAELAQVWRDNPSVRTGEQANAKTPAEKEAAAIAAAHRLEPSQPAAAFISPSDLLAREAAIIEAEAAAQELIGKATNDRAEIEQARTALEADRALLAQTAKEQSEQAAATLAQIEQAKAELAAAQAAAGKKGGK